MDVEGRDREGRRDRMLYERVLVDKQIWCHDKVIIPFHKFVFVPFKMVQENPGGSRWNL